jgi:hypothetical protein
MKKAILLFLYLLSGHLKAQPSASIAVQFYVDANSNCVYNLGEQLLYNVPFTISYVTAASTVQTLSYGTPTFQACGATTLYPWNPQLSPVNNTLTPILAGLSANLSCGVYTNIAYNTNSIVYLPVSIAPGNAVGGTIGSFICGSGPAMATNTNVPMNGGTVGLCSNVGNDSLSINFNLVNIFGCNPSSSVSPRTYSLILDGSVFDTFTLTSGFFSNTFSTSLQNGSQISEWYTNSQAYINVYPSLPSSFTVLGTHTLQIKSSLIYNNAQSFLDFSCVVNSIPCSKVTGRFYNDCNNNCIFDGTDSYGVGYHATGLIYNSAINYSLTFHPNYTDGKYSVYLPTTHAYSLTQYPTVANPSLSPTFTACTLGTITIPAGGGTYTYTFGYKNNGAINVDPGVYFSRLNSTSNNISPLVGVTFGIQLTNASWNICGSSQLNPGKVKVTLPKFINYLSSVSGPTPTFVTGPLLDTLIWTVPNFSTAANWWASAFASFSAVVNATAVANTNFTINTTIYPTTDINLSNNSFNWIRTVGGPFDPNGKWTEAPGLQPNGDVPFGTTQFIYKIGFQNIGNAPAINVKTADTMDVNFDLSSLRVLQSSYPVSTQINHQTREVLFYFNGIYLPDATTNEPGSHGFVRYSIQLKPGVPVNTVLKNRAHNYFDFNEAVATNQTSNKLVVATAINEMGEVDYSLRAMPNPFSDGIRIVSEQEITHVAVYNLLGELVNILDTDSKEVALSLTELSSGIYIVKVSYGHLKTSSIKVIKQ